MRHLIIQLWCDRLCQFSRLCQFKATSLSLDAEKIGCHYCTWIFLSTFLFIQVCLLGCSLVHESAASLSVTEFPAHELEGVASIRGTGEFPWLPTCGLGFSPTPASPRSSSIPTVESCPVSSNRTSLRRGRVIQYQGANSYLNSFASLRGFKESSSFRTTFTSFLD